MTKDAHFERLRSAARNVFENPEARFLLGEFFQVAGIDASALRATATDMAHAIGWQDAGAWWIDLLRQHCPEREAQVRKERISYLNTKEAAPVASHGDDENASE